jgi:hypothetical protein
VNSKDPNRIEFPELGDEGADDTAGDDDEVVDIMAEETDAESCADRLPTDSANYRGCSSAMPTLWGLGLMESCRLIRDIEYQINGERDLPRFGALDAVKPLLPSCLILIIENIGLQWSSRRL